MRNHLYEVTGFMTNFEFSHHLFVGECRDIGEREVMH